MIEILRWLLLIGFLCQIVGIVYGVYVLVRIKSEQRALADILAVFSERSERIAQALTEIRKNGR